GGRPGVPRCGRPTARPGHGAQRRYDLAAARGRFPRRRRGGGRRADSGPGQLLEQEDERLVAPSGRALEPDLAGAVASEVGVELLTGELLRLLAGGGLGEFRV